jgi:hypothetical protein
MKTLIITLAAAAALAIWPGADAQAHKPHRYVRSHVSVGIGLGYPYYRPYRYYPRSWVGVSLWPRPVATRVRTRERAATAGAHQLYVYPAAGQSQRQLADDRYDCHVWSVEQTRFDPTLGAGNRREAEEYARAMTACLEARNYVVR